MNTKEMCAVTRVAREWVDALLQEATAYAGESPNPFLVRVRDKLLREAPLPSAPTVQQAAAMSDDESRQFGNTLMPFGTHYGCRIDEVPIDYLEWLDKQEDFRDLLRRYLRSQRVMRERG